MFFDVIISVCWYVKFLIVLEEFCDFIDWYISECDYCGYIFIGIVLSVVVDKVFICGCCVKCYGNRMYVWVW